MLAFTVAYKIFLLSLLSQKRLKNVKYLTEGGREECDLLLWCWRKKTSFIYYHLPWAIRAEVWFVRGDHLWFGFFPCLFLVLDQSVVADCGGQGLGGAALAPSSGDNHSPPLLLGHQQAKLPLCPSDFLNSHGFSSAVRESQLKTKKGWWQGVFPSNCEACYVD